MSIILDLLFWIGAGIAIIGTLRVKNKDHTGFLFWIVSNFIMVITNYLIGIYAMCVLFSFYIYISVAGYIQWKKDKAKETMKSE